MISELAFGGAAIGAGIALKCVLQFVVTIWSLRSDERDRQYALKVLRSLQPRGQSDR